VTGDEALVQAMLTDWRTAPVPPREMAMLEYAVMITADVHAVSPATLDGLRAHGYDDTAILQIATIASWFNYINRMADGLGVGRPG
jgi:uncharacterized peroxidase-related enzyme